MLDLIRLVDLADTYPDERPTHEGPILILKECGRFALPTATRLRQLFDWDYLIVKPTEAGPTLSGLNSNDNPGFPT